MCRFVTLSCRGRVIFLGALFVFALLPGVGTHAYALNVPVCDQVKHSYSDGTPYEEPEVAPQNGNGQNEDPNGTKDLSQTDVSPDPQPNAKEKQSKGSPAIFAQLRVLWAWLHSIHAIW